MTYTELPRHDQWAAASALCGSLIAVRVRLFAFVFACLLRTQQLEMKAALLAFALFGLLAFASSTVHFQEDFDGA